MTDADLQAKAREPIPFEEEAKALDRYCRRLNDGSDGEEPWRRIARALRCAREAGIREAAEIVRGKRGRERERTK